MQNVSLGTALIITEFAELHSVALSLQGYCYVRGDLNYKLGGF